MSKPLPTLNSTQPEEVQKWIMELSFKTQIDTSIQPSQIFHCIEGEAMYRVARIKTDWSKLSAKEVLETLENELQEIKSPTELFRMAGKRAARGRRENWSVDRIYYELAQDTFAFTRRRAQTARNQMLCRNKMEVSSGEGGLQRIQNSRQH